MKNIFGYKKSSSRQSENRVCLVSLDEVGEKKMMATLSTIMDDTPHPHTWTLSAQGSSFYGRHLHK